MKKRYFMIMFSGLSSDSTLRTGKIEYRTTDGKHVNEKIILDKIEKQFGLSLVFVKGVVEMQEQDFMDWIAGRDEQPPELPPHVDDGGFL
jgi:hypothetical protein